MRKGGEKEERGDGVRSSEGVKGTEKEAEAWNTRIEYRNCMNEKIQKRIVLYISTVHNKKC